MIHVLLIAVLSLAGCYSSGNASIKNQELIAQVQMGKSTKEDVRRLFGEPDSVTRTSSQVASAGNPSQMVMIVEWWSYTHASAQTDAKSFIPFVGWFLGGSTYESDYFQVGYDTKGVVQHVTSGASKGKSGLLSSQ